MRRLFVGNRNAEAAAELDQLLLVELLLLMGDVAAFARLAQPIALDRLGQDDRGRALVLDGRLVGRIDLGRIVAAAFQFAKLVVAEIGHHRQQPRIDAEEMLADIRAGRDDVFLIVAIDHFAHAADQQAVAIAGQERVPIGAPKHFDHVPAGAAEGAFQLLDDLAVAADRAVQPLQVAVDDEDQVVQLLAAGQGDGPQGLGLVAFAVAQEGPHPRGLGVGLDAAIDQIMVEAGLVNGHDRAQAHRDRGKFPEVGHQPGMGIRRQSRRRAANSRRKFFNCCSLSRPSRNARAYIPGAAWPWKKTWSGGCVPCLP